MPLTEKEMTYYDMQKAVNDSYLCAECQGVLSVAWKDGWILRCQNINHTGITRHDIKFENKKKEHLSMDSTALTTMDESKMLARVDMARFPQDLTLPEKRLLAQVAITYGFDPLMGEVTIYQGRPYVSIDGRYRKAQETERLDGVESRPATEQERVNWGITEGDYFFRADVWVKGSRMPFVGWGRVFKTETIGGKGFKPVEKNPQRMAEKRAEAQALRKAFHINLPSIEDIGSPEEELPTRVVDITTGEITGRTTQTVSKQQVSNDTQSQRMAQPAPAASPEPNPAPEKAKQVESIIPKNPGELCQWALKHGKQYGPAWVSKEAGVKSVSEIKDVEQTYLNIKSVTGWED